MQSYGENRTLTPQFDHIAITIEESKDLETISVEELPNFLVPFGDEAHLVQDEDGSNSDCVLLVVTTNSGKMILPCTLIQGVGDPSVKSSVKFADNSIIMEDKVLITQKDGKKHI